MLPDLNKNLSDKVGAVHFRLFQECFVIFLL